MGQIDQTDPVLIIPMAGRGKRFERANYSDYKPFIKINGLPMYGHVLKNFPSNIRKYFVICSSFLSDVNLRELRAQENAVVVNIPEHSLGPAYSLSLAKDRLPQNAPWFIAYCDISWVWQQGFNPMLIKEDAAIFTYTGFHPHQVLDPVSAFCRPAFPGASILESVKEKQPFTEDWMSEPLAAGIFYVTNASRFITALTSMIQEQDIAAGEYYISPVFNHLMAGGTTVNLIPLSSFVHWGIPERVDDIERWQRVLRTFSKDARKKTNPFDGSTKLLLMAGLGTRMRVFTSGEKPFLDVRGEPMHEFISNLFPGDTLNIVANPEWSVPNCIRVGRQPASIYSTLQLLRGKLSEADSLFVLSCDCFGDVDYERLNDLKINGDPDVIGFLFTPSLVQKKLRNYLRAGINDKGELTEIKDRGVSSGDLGVAGFFWVKNTSVLLSLPDDERRYQRNCLAEFLKEGLKVMCYVMNDYVHIGTPEEYKEFLFWNMHLENLISLKP